MSRASVEAALVVAAQYRQLTRRVVRGQLEGADAEDVTSVLYRRYEQGFTYPRALDAAQGLTAPTGEIGPLVVNLLVCVEVAAGRYREALAWRARWPEAVGAGEPERLIRINEAEALACLGRPEESLAWTDYGDAVTDYVRTGRAMHRAWVFAELGRFDEARASFDEPGVAVQNLDQPYQAECHFARYALALASREWTLAAQSLESASKAVVRASSRRNVHFFKGRLAFAQGDLSTAVVHFARGATNRYRGQGGPALLEWGDALRGLHREAEARVAWRRCSAEDPQSPCAVVAAARLVEAPAPA